VYWKLLKKRSKVSCATETMDCRKDVSLANAVSPFKDYERKPSSVKPWYILPPFV
jgi:hypothetical protein